MVCLFSFVFFFPVIKLIKNKSAAPSAIEVKKTQKTISAVEKSELINLLGKGEHIVNICLEHTAYNSL